MNLRDCVWETRYRIIMKTILQEKVKIHYSITNRFTNLFLCLKLWKFQQQKQQWIRNGKNWRKFRRGTWQKSEVRKMWSMKQGRRAKKFTSHHLWTYVIWKMLSWRQSTKNTKGRVVLRRDIVKDDSGSYALFCWTRIISITNDRSKSHGYHLKIACLRGTSSRHSISFFPSENGRCSQTIENSQFGMSRHLDSSTTTQMP